MGILRLVSAVNFTILKFPGNTLRTKSCCNRPLSPDSPQSSTIYTLNDSSKKRPLTTK
jgi:hypothetical protein